MAHDAGGERGARVAEVAARGAVLAPAVKVKHLWVRRKARLADQEGACLQVKARLCSVIRRGQR